MASTDHKRSSRWPPFAFAVMMALALVLAACGSDRARTSTAGTSDPNAVQGIQRPDPLDVGDVTLPEVRVGSPDQPFTMRADPGTLLFVYFGYTNCPDLCPTTLADLHKALTRLGPDASRVRLAFVTVDPNRDTPAILGPYLASFVPGAHALRTLDPAALQRAEDAFLASSTITTSPQGAYEVSHSATAYLVDPSGKVVDELPFGSGSDAMASDLRILLARSTATSSPTTTRSTP